MGTAPVVMSFIITFLCSSVHTWGRFKTQSPTLSPITVGWGNIWPTNFQQSKRLDQQLQHSRVLIFITFLSSVYTRSGQLLALNTCIANILEKDTKRGPQIIQVRTVIGYDVLFRFLLQIHRVLIHKPSQPSYESKYSAKKSNAFPFELTMRSGNSSQNILTHSVS